MSVDQDGERPPGWEERDAHLRGALPREALVARVEAALSRAPDGGYLLVVGGPGAGKSALLADLSARWQAPFHFLRSHRDPARFVASLVAQARAASGRDAGPGAGAPLGTTPDDLKAELIASMRALAQSGRRARFVLDGLDLLGSSGDVWDFLPPILPPGVHVVLSLRPGLALLHRLRARLDPLAEIEIGPLTLAELHLAAERALAGSPSPPSDAALAELHAVTGGHALLVFRALARARRTGELDAHLAASNARALYESSWRDAEDRGGPLATQLTELLALAAEPLEIGHAHALLVASGGFSPPSLGETRAAIEALSEVLQDGGSERLALWHRGYSEHIQSERLGRDGEARVHALYADLATRPEHSTYARKHGVHHLWHAGRRTEARALAERPDRLATELQADRLSQLLAELALVGSPLFGALRRHGALLGARPDALASVLELEGGGRGPGVRLRALRKPSEEPARPKVSLRAGDGEVLALAPSPRGDRLATASADGWVRLWDTATGVELAQRRLGHRRVLSLAFSPSGLLLACGTDDRGVVLLDAELVERECVAHEAPVWGVAWLGGDRLVTGSRAGGVKVFDLRGALLWSARAHDQIACLATSGDGRTLLLGGARGGLGVFATQGRLGVDPVTSARLAPELEVTVWAAREHGGRWVFVHHDGAVLTLVASPEDPAQLRLGAELRLPDERLYALAAVDDVFLCAGSSGRVYAVALEGGKVVLQSSLDAGVGAVNALATTDDTIWVGGSTGDVQAFSLDPLVLGSSPSPSASVEPPPSCAAYSIRADEVVLGSLDGRLRIATPPELETVCEVVAFDTSVSAVAFDQRLVAAGAKDGQLALFKRTASGLSRLGVLRGHEAAISSVRLLRGSGLVASGSRDHSLRLWSVFGARPLGVVVLDAGVREVVVSPGGASLAAVSRDGEVRVVAVSSLEDIASFRLEGELVDLHLFGGGASVREVIGGACVVRHLRFGGAAGEPVELAPVLVSGRSSAGRALGLQATEAAVYDSSGRRLVSAPLDFTHAARAGDAAEWLLLDAFGPRVVRLEDEGSNA